MKPTRAPQRPRDRSWRVTTAIRVFALALASGQVLSAGSLGSVGVVLVALVLVGAACCAVELQQVWHTPWVPVVEGVLAASLLGPATGPVEPLLVYLAVPCVVAGVRHGWVTTANTSLASAAAMMASWGAAQTLGGTEAPVAACPALAGARARRRPAGRLADPLGAEPRGRPGAVRRRTPPRRSSCTP